MATYGSRPDVVIVVLLHQYQKDKLVLNSKQTDTPVTRLSNVLVHCHILYSIASWSVTLIFSPDPWFFDRNP